MIGGEVAATSHTAKVRSSDEFGEFDPNLTLESLTFPLLHVLVDASDATQRALTVFHPSLHILPVHHLGQQRIQVTVDHELWA